MRKITLKLLTLLLCLSICFAIAMGTAYLISARDKGNIRADFISYGKHTMTSISCPDGPLVLLGCPDSNDAVLLAESRKRQSYTYTIIAQSSPLEELDLAQLGAAGTVIASSDMFKPWEKEELSAKFAELNTEIVFLDGEEVFSGGDFSAGFRNFDIGENTIPSVFCEYKGTSFVSLQEFDGYALKKLGEQNVSFQCDVMKLSPNLPMSEDTYEMLSSGEILTDEKSFSIKLY